MSWLDQLQPASFRGVAFHVDTIDLTAGDNVVLREYPFQDLPTVFRMGEGAEEIKLAAYVIGDDYIEQRDALRQVLTGSGVLVHPTAGSIRVFVAGKYSVREAPAVEGGMARFDLVFVRAEPRRYPVGAANSGQTAIERAGAAKAAAKQAFAAQWRVTQQPGWVADRLVERIRATIGGVWGQMAGASAQLGGYVNTAIGNYQVLRDNLNSLVATPAQLADHIATLFELPEELSTASARRLQAAFEPFFNARERIADAGFETVVLPAVGAGLVLFGTGSTVALQTDSAARATLKRMSAAGDRLVDTLATAAWVEAATAVELSNVDEAMGLRAKIHAQCIRLLSEASADGALEALTVSHWHDAVAALHTASLADLQARSRDLVRLDTYTPGAWTPVWVISYQLYGTPDYADELLAMNPHIEHPLLVPPGRPLRVVRHD